MGNPSLGPRDWLRGGCQTPVDPLRAGSGTCWSSQERVTLVTLFPAGFWAHRMCVWSSWWPFLKLHVKSLSRNEVNKERRAESWKEVADNIICAPGSSHAWNQFSKFCLLEPIRFLFLAQTGFNLILVPCNQKIPAWYQWVWVLSWRNN